jgi:hypothetical protein
MMGLRLQDALELDGRRQDALADVDVGDNHPVADVGRGSLGCRFNAHDVVPYC